MLAILAATADQMLLAAICILIAMLADLWDGKIARALGAEHPLGADLDSLADMVTSGVAPAIILSPALSRGSSLAEALSFAEVLGFNLVILIPAVWYAMAAALRLAKFNVITSDDPQFWGLPTTLANGVSVTAAT